LLSISIRSGKLSTATTSIHGIIEASFELAFGTKILLNHLALAHIVAGNTDSTLLSLPSRDNSQMNIESFISVSSINHSCNSIQIAIGKSKLGPDFLIFAGARFTVILVIGNLFQDDFNADLSLSLLS
jgi:hypothetical protein